MRSKASKGEEEKEYEFPGEEGGTSIKYRIYALKVEELKIIGRKCGIPTSQNKRGLLEALRAFSLDKDQWELIKPGCRRTHKGRQEPSNEGRRKKVLTGSHKRCLELVSTTQDIKTGGRTTTAIEPNGRLLAWAKQYSEAHPCYPHSPLPQPIHESRPMLIGPHKALYEKLDTLQHGVDLLCQAQSLNTVTPLCTAAVTVNTCALTSMPASPPSVDMEINSPPPASHSLTLPTSDQGPPTVNPSIPNYSPKQIRLSNGTLLTFTRGEVQDPKLFSLVKNIEQLGSLWTDRNLEFDPTKCEVQIQGRGIALKYWKDVFKLERHDGTDQRWGMLNRVLHEWVTSIPVGILMGNRYP